MSRYEICGTAFIRRVKTEGSVVLAAMSLLLESRVENKTRHQNVTVKIAVFCDVPPCSIPPSYRRFGGTCYLMYIED